MTNNAINQITKSKDGVLEIQTRDHKREGWKA